MESNPTELNPPARPRIVGLDAIRFVLATWVVMGHFGFPDPTNAVQNPTAGFLIRGGIHNLFNGPAAVIAFFVISGFCIHYGTGNSDSLFLPAYFTRRWIRTLVPMFAAIAISKIADVKLALFSDSILWSLLCEEIYYLLYPLLLRLRSRLSWPQILALSLCGAIGLVLSSPHTLDYPMFGAAFNWILGLPCWILGCVLAERVQSGALPVVSRREIWSWRAGVWALSSVASVLRFHSGIGYPWTLTAFAFVVFPWLLREISAARRFGTLRWLERAGLWSYSLYLMHLALGALVSPWASWPEQSLSVWALRCLVAFAGSYAFSRVFELPMHQFARRAYHRVVALRMSESWRAALTVGA